MQDDLIAKNAVSPYKMQSNKRNKPRNQDHPGDNSDLQKRICGESGLKHHKIQSFLDQGLCLSECL